MHEKVTVVVKVDPDTEDWEVVGAYIPEDADAAIAYLEKKSFGAVFAKVTLPVLSFRGPIV